MDRPPIVTLALRITLSGLKGFEAMRLGALVRVSGVFSAREAVSVVEPALGTSESRRVCADIMQVQVNLKSRSYGNIPRLRHARRARYKVRP